MIEGAPSQLVDATCAFLRRHPPFDRIDEPTLRAAVEKLQPAVFPRGATILSAQSGPVAQLHIIERGVVARCPNDTQAKPDLTLGPGDMFPVGALSAAGTTTKVFEALEETRCYLLARADFLELRRASPEFERFCTQAITETLRQSLDSLYAEYRTRAAEQQTLARTLGELVRNAPVSCAQTATLREAAQKMADAKVRTIVVVGDEGAPVGMFTLVDLLRRVVLAEKPLTAPVSEAMTTPIVTLPSTVTAYEAMRTLAEHGIRQIVVVDNGRISGVVNERDLFALQRVSMRQVIEGLHAADTVERLARSADDIRGLTQNLLAQGVAAEPLTRTIAALNDALSRRAIDLVLARHDLGDTDWCWLALGSEGRGEQTFATDQDNALVFRAADDADAARRREALLAFGRDVNGVLDRLGFPLCTGNVMAGNPEMCLSAEEWKRTFLGWIREPRPEALLGANILFDFRALHGNRSLADGLRDWLGAYTPANPVFLRFLVENALAVEPPLGFIRAFSVDDEGPVRGTIDLKTRGTRIFVDCARVFALALGLPDTSTAARMRAAAERLGVEPRHVDATVEAFHFLQLLRLRQQHRGGGHAGANRIDPYALNDVDQRMLKEAFRQARQLQERLRLQYRL